QCEAAMTEVKIPATVIGSWSFPGWFDAFNTEVARHPERYGMIDREEAVRDAVVVAIDDQVRAGLDRITDGEMRRVDFNLGFYEFLEGLQPLQQARQWGAPAHDQRSKYLCTAPLKAAQGLGLVDEYRRLRALTGAPVKMPVPGAFTLAGCIAGGEVYS